MCSSILKLALIIILLDSVFLYLIAPHFASQIQKVQGRALTVDFLSAILCYILIIFGVYHFIILPKRGILDAFLLGIVIYGVYETTSKALLANWMWKTVAIDTMWGGILFAATTYIFRKI